jgi:hypothetical protein
MTNTIFVFNENSLNGFLIGSIPVQARSNSKNKTKGGMMDANTSFVLSLLKMTPEELLTIMHNYIMKIATDKDNDIIETRMRLSMLHGELTARIYHGRA